MDGLASLLDRQPHPLPRRARTKTSFAKAKLIRSKTVILSEVGGPAFLSALYNATREPNQLRKAKLNRTKCDLFRKGRASALP